MMKVSLSCHGRMLMLRSPSVDACLMQANAKDLAAGEVAGSFNDLQKAIDGMRAVMSIHSQWMLSIFEKNITPRAELGIPQDYEKAISTNNEEIFWKAIEWEKHTDVSELVGLESLFIQCLSLLQKASLLDEDCQTKMQDLQNHLTRHRLYTSSVSAVDTIITTVIPLKSSRDRKRQFDSCPLTSVCMSLCCCINIVFVGVVFCEYVTVSIISQGSAGNCTASASSTCPRLLNIGSRNSSTTEKRRRRQKIAKPAPGGCVLKCSRHCLLLCPEL